MFPGEKNCGQLRIERVEDADGKADGQAPHTAGSRTGADSLHPPVQRETGKAQGFANWLKLYQTTLRQIYERSLSKESFRGEETGRVEA